MATINLLPWRAELKKQKQQEFTVAMAIGITVTLVLFGIVYFYLEGMKDYQQKRNQMLEHEIRIVERKIGETIEIESMKAQMLEKIGLIETLQKSRPQSVHLFDELARRTPDEIYLTKVTQQGSLLTFEGKAQSNISISAYMRAIGESAWFESPTLHSSRRADNGEQVDFTMSAKQRGDGQ